MQHTVWVFHGFSKWFPAVRKSQNTQEPTLDPFHAREPATLASDAGGFPLAPQVAGQSAYWGSGEAYKGEGKRMDLEVNNFETQSFS